MIRNQEFQQLLNEQLEQNAELHKNQNKKIKMIKSQERKKMKRKLNKITDSKRTFKKKKIRRNLSDETEVRVQMIPDAVLREVNTYSFENVKSESSATSDFLKNLNDFTSDSFEKEISKIKETEKGNDVDFF
jgi:hypothetical protein